MIVSQQRFIATMQGRTSSLSSFNDAQFDEAAFEARMEAERTAMMVCIYWILKLKARFLSGDYAGALAAAEKAKALLWSTAAHIELLDFYTYTALTMAVLYDDAPTKQQTAWRDLLAGPPGPPARMGRHLQADIRRQACLGLGRMRPP